MRTLLTILRRAHCHPTHHRFAIDALSLMQTAAGKRLARLIARHHDRYLTGAIDPDIRFRDFQNHVIHVTDGYWGGAPRVAHSWYDRLQRYLRSNRFSDAAHAAGVLSHYFTDVMQPLHTETCQKERVLHRPIECCIRENYDAIYRRWEDDEMRVVFQLSCRHGWLGEAMLHGARFAHRKRQLLLDHFWADTAAQDPRQGLSIEAQAALSELFGLTITGLARVLERAAGDAEAGRASPLPRVSLAIPTILAAIDVPLRFWTGWFRSRAERTEVAALLEEFQRTGKIQEHLPAEVDITHRVVKVYQDEQRWTRQRNERLESRQTIVAVESTPEPIPVTIPFVPRDRKESTQTPRRRSA